MDVSERVSPSGEAEEWESDWLEDGERDTRKEEGGDVLIEGIEGAAERFWSEGTSDVRIRESWPNLACAPSVLLGGFSETQWTTVCSSGWNVDMLVISLLLNLSQIIPMLDGRFIRLYYSFISFRFDKSYVNERHSIDFVH